MPIILEITSNDISNKKSESISNKRSESISNNENKTDNVICNLFKMALNYCRQIYKKLIVKSNNQEIDELNNLLLELDKLDKENLLQAKEFSRIDRLLQKEKKREKEEQTKEEKTRQLDHENIRNELHRLEIKKKDIKTKITTLNKELALLNANSKEIDKQYKLIKDEEIEKLRVEEELNRINQENDKIQSEKIKQQLQYRNNVQKNYLEKREKIIRKIDELKEILDL